MEQTLKCKIVNKSVRYKQNTPIRMQKYQINSTKEEFTPVRENKKHTKKSVRNMSLEHKVDNGFSLISVMFRRL